MERRALGRTGLKVSEIGFGCWGIGKGMWKAEDATSRLALQEALGCGMNFFDTAFVYGNGHSESLVAAETAGEKGVVIASKVPPKNREWPARLDAPIGEVFPEEYVYEMGMRSFENLGRRKMDILQLHVWSDRWTDEPAWRRAFARLKDEGACDFFGVSVNDHAPGTAVKLAKSGFVDSLQVIYNIFDQSPEDELFDAARENGVGIIARVPLDEGSLSGKFTEGTRFDDWRSRYFTPERMPEVVRRVEALRKLLEKPGRTLPQAALAFCLSNKAVSSVIPGMRTLEHVRANAAVSGMRLSKGELSEIKKHRWDRNFYGKDY